MNMWTYPTFFAGEVKEEWGWRVGEQVMSAFACATKTTSAFNKLSGTVASASISDAVLQTLFINTFYIPRSLIYTQKGLDWTPSQL